MAQLTLFPFAGLIPPEHAGGFPPKTPFNMHKTL